MQKKKKRNKKEKENPELSRAKQKARLNPVEFKISDYISRQKGTANIETKFYRFLF